MLVYSEILRKKKPNIEIVPELWYLNNNNEKKRVILDFTEENIELKRINDIIAYYKHIDHSDELPLERKDKVFCSQTCKMFEYRNKIFIQEPNISKKVEVSWKTLFKR